MSETSKDMAPAAPPPAPRNSPLDPPAPRRLDPAAIMIGVGGVVLLVALWWLLNTPRATSDSGVDPARVAQIEQRLGTLEGVRGELGTLTGRLNAFSAVEGRVQAVENRPAPAIPDIRPLEQQLNALAERISANDRRLGSLEGRAVPDTAGFAQRAAVEALAARLEQLGAAEQRQEAEIARRLGEAEQADRQREQSAAQALQQRLQEMMQADQQREQSALQALQQRLQEMRQADEQRDQADEQRDQAAQQRLQQLEASLNQKIAALEQAQSALKGQLDRATRMAAIDRARAALVAGRPLGEALGGLGQPPAPLARFAQAAPPTEAALRQGFEDAVRAARDAQAKVAANETGRPPGVEGALSRIESLVTVRKGDQMLWGASIEPDIERARRALEAGDLEMSVQTIEKLPAPALDAMKGWLEQAKGLIAARAALRQLAAG